MIYLCTTQHIKTGKRHVFRTVYPYSRGEIIYPWHLQSEYPEHDQNKHVVLTCRPLNEED